MTHKVVASVDRNRCVGNAGCVAIAPDVFALDDSMQSVVVDTEGAPRGLIVEAAEACPVEAISVVEADTGESVFP